MRLGEHGLVYLREDGSVFFTQADCGAVPYYFVCSKQGNHPENIIYASGMNERTLVMFLDEEGLAWCNKYQLFAGQKLKAISNSGKHYYAIIEDGRLLHAY